MWVERPQQSKSVHLPPTTNPRTRTTVRGITEAAAVFGYDSLDVPRSSKPMPTDRRGRRIRIRGGAPFSEDQAYDRHLVQKHPEVHRTEHSKFGTRIHHHRNEQSNHDAP